MIKLLSIIISIFIILINLQNLFPKDYFENFPKNFHISGDSLFRYLEILGSDQFEGRGTGTLGGNKAAEFIKKKLIQFGLKSGGESSSYFQRIPMHGSTPQMESALRLFSTGGVENFEYFQDYLIYRGGAQTYIPNEVPVVFVGYGIIAPEFDYNDYQTADVSGKFAVYLSGEPHSENQNYFGGSRRTIYSLPEAKHRLATSRGAIGTIMIPNPLENTWKDWQYWQKQFSFENISLWYSAANNLSILMRLEAAKKLFIDAPSSLNEIIKSLANHHIQSFDLNTKISFKGDFNERDFVSSNVIGLIEGNDPNLKDSYLILSAHYDHLGIGPPVLGDSIYNGVIDNAVGVSALLEIGRILGKMKIQPKRSVIFLFLTGEEKGLLGSGFYIDHPVVPLHKSLANLNIDGLAIFDTFKDVIGIGSEFSTLRGKLEQVSAELNMTVSDIPDEFLRNETFERSDQISFAQGGIPSILVLEGVNYDNLSVEEGVNKHIHWMQNYYHSPFDDLDQKINRDAARQHADFLLHYIWFLLNDEEPPVWYKNSPYYNIRLQTIAEQR